MPRPSMADIARAEKVSKNTVSLALRNDPRISEGTRRRVEKAAERLGYRRNAVIGELMAHVRKIRTSGFQATLALVNANQDRNALTRHPTVPSYVEGARRRADELGYSLDPFWMHDPEVPGKSLVRILRARGIRGVLIVGLMNQNRLPEHFLPVVNAFPCVVAGVRTRDPALSFACVDHHMLTLRAFERALELGYKRPGLVLDEVIDELVAGRFSAGYFISQQAIPVEKRLQPFYKVAAARRNPELFQGWLETEQPDVVFTLYNVVEEWIKAAGKKIPDDIGLIQLEWRKNRPEWAGMNQHNDIVGEAAVEMLGSLIHNRESGPPAFPRATLIGSSWVDGATVRSTQGRTAPTAPSRRTPSGTR